MVFNDLIGKNGVFIDGDWIESKDQDPNGNVRLIQLADIGEGEFKNKSNKYITSQKADEFHCTLLKKGDILISRLGDPLCKACIFPLDGMYITAVDVAILRIDSNDVSREYITYMINSPWFKSQVKLYESGTTRKRISRKNLNKIDFLLPAKDEQERIVSRIEELFSQLDDGVETLKKTKAQLAVYRQAVLKEAFSDLNGEKMTIDDVCREVKVGIVIKPAQYYTSPELGVKAFRSANVREFHIDDFDWVYLSKEGQEKNTRTIVHMGDILIVRSGYPGTACVVTEDFDGCNAIDVLIAVPNQEIVTPDYLCAYTNSPLGKSFVAEKKRGVGQKHFNVNGYKKMPIVVPPKEKQQEIVSIIAARLSVCDNINQTVDAALQQADALRQSILKQAFEGGL